MSREGICGAIAVLAQTFITWRMVRGGIAFEACGLPVPLSSLERGVCPSGHVWSQYGLTLCLATDARCSSCIQCGTTVNNALTLSMEDGKGVE